VKTNINRSAWPWLWISVFVIMLDQCSKYLVLQHVLYDNPIRVFPFLNVMLRFNTGAAFSFLESANGWQVFVLAGISIVISLCLIVWVFRLTWCEWILAMPLCLILGGALGNLIDRLRFGYVVDFIDFHVGGWHFATFNIADSAVSIGATVLVIRLLYESITRQS